MEAIWKRLALPAEQIHAGGHQRAGERAQWQVAQLRAWPAPVILANVEAVLAARRRRSPYRLEVALSWN
jgi:hypothetical protein